MVLALLQTLELNKPDSLHCSLHRPCCSKIDVWQLLCLLCCTQACLMDASAAERRGEVGVP